MNTQAQPLPNGAGAAAVLAAGVGSFLLAALAIAADHLPAFKAALVFSVPVGALSGESTCAVAVWLVLWALLDLLWKRRDVSGWLAWLGVGLMASAFLLMFPPFGDLF